MAAKAYSFKDVTASFDGPTGNIEFGYGAGVSDEGITIDPVGDKNTMTIGSDASGMHSLHADKSAHVEVSLLQTSSTNALMQAQYDAQQISSSLWGQNTIVVAETQSGDVHTMVQCAFKRQPRFKYGKDGQMVVWSFDVVQYDRVLGTY